MLTCVAIVPPDLSIILHLGHSFPCFCPHLPLSALQTLCEQPKENEALKSKLDKGLEEGIRLLRGCGKSRLRREGGVRPGGARGGQWCVALDFGLESTAEPCAQLCFGRQGLFESSPQAFLWSI